MTINGVVKPKGKLARGGTLENRYSSHRIGQFK
jgi:hypothetical protein